MSELAEIHVIGLPVEIHRRAAEYYDELLREFALLVGAEPSHAHTVPGRLVALGEELTDRFSGFTAEPESALAEALDNNAVTVDLVYQLPGDVADASERLNALFDEAEEYCRSGDGLLTMAAADDVLAYRRWFLAEFADQPRGAPPKPWPGV